MLCAVRIIFANACAGFRTDCRRLPEVDLGHRSRSGQRDGPHNGRHVDANPLADLLVILEIRKMTAFHAQQRCVADSNLPCDFANASTTALLLEKPLCRPESKLAVFNPSIHPQGSFRYGTVVRQIPVHAEYDLDNVTTLEIGKTALSQKEIKELYGAEIRSYAEAHSMIAPVEEKNRCWRLRYSDEVAFHLDALPCVPEEQAVINAIVARGVPNEWAQIAVAITDKRHPDYERITRALFSSNPRGFARWFEQRLRASALDRINLLVKQRAYASVEDVPA
jgi:hypothetical protein